MSLFNSRSSNEQNQQSTNQTTQFSVSGDVDGNLVYGNNNTVLDGGAISGAFQFADDSQNNAFAFAGGAAQLAIENIRESQNDAFEFAAGAAAQSYGLQANALENNLQFAQMAFESNLATNNAALTGISKASENALTFAAGAFDGALDVINERSEDFSNTVSEFATKTINTAVNATKTESAQALDKIIDLTGDSQRNIMFAAAAGVALLLLLRK